MICIVNNTDINVYFKTKLDPLLFLDSRAYHNSLHITPVFALTPNPLPLIIKIVPLLLILPSLLKLSLIHI